MAGEKTYYWDDVKFGSLVNVKDLNAADAGIRIYPNPALDFCLIEFPEAISDPAQLSVLDVNGRLVRVLQITQQNTRLDLNGIQNGIYYLKIQKDSRNYFQKLVIVR
jgi:hypothetical protein